MYIGWKAIAVSEEGGVGYGQVHHRGSRDERAFGAECQMNLIRKLRFADVETWAVMRQVPVVTASLLLVHFRSFLLHLHV